MYQPGKPDMNTTEYKYDMYSYHIDSKPISITVYEAYVLCNVFIVNLIYCVFFILDIHGKSYTIF